MNIANFFHAIAYSSAFFGSIIWQHSFLFTLFLYYFLVLIERREKHAFQHFRSCWDKWWRKKVSFRNGNFVSTSWASEQKSTQGITSFHFLDQNERKILKKSVYTRTSIKASPNSLQPTMYWKHRKSSKHNYGTPLEVRNIDCWKRFWQQPKSLSLCSHRKWSHQSTTCHVSNALCNQPSTLAIVEWMY